MSSHLLLLKPEEGSRNICLTGAGPLPLPLGAANLETAVACEITLVDDEECREELDDTNLTVANLVLRSLGLLACVREILLRTFSRRFCLSLIFFFGPKR